MPVPTGWWNVLSANCHPFMILSRDWRCRLRHVTREVSGATHEMSYHVLLGILDQHTWAEMQRSSICTLYFRRGEMRRWFLKMSCFFENKWGSSNSLSAWKVDHLERLLSYHILLITAFPKHTLAGASSALWGSWTGRLNVISWGRREKSDMPFVVSRPFWLLWLL